MINIAIDGPSGAGKSFLSRAIAKKLGYIYVDTGALYRALALGMIEMGIDPRDTDSVVKGLSGIVISLEYGEDGEQAVMLNGKAVSSMIRTPEISMAASAVSAIPAVRAFLLGLQKDMAKTRNVVMDGRDIGTVILPNAQVKIFLCASDKARARRRFAELTEKGMAVTLEQIERDMRQRDRNDSTRAVAPAIAADDAVVLDNSELSRDETLEAALKIIAEKLS